MIRRSLAVLLLVTSLSVSALTVNLGKVRIDLEPPDETEVYPGDACHTFLLPLGDGKTLGVIHLHSSEEIGYTVEELTAFYQGDTNDFLADLLADLRRAISESTHDFALRWGGYNTTSAKQVYLASADYYDTVEETEYYNLDSLLLLGGLLIYVDGYCRAEDAEAFREIVIATVSSITEHEWR